MKKLFFLTFFLLFSSLAHSAVILKIKGRKALVDLEGVNAEKGDKFDALNLYGKALGLLEIKKVKKGKAIAVLLKGKMGISWILEPSSQDGGSFTTSTEEEYDPVDNTDSKASKSWTNTKAKKSSTGGVGVLGGIHWNSITTKPGQSVSGFSYKGALFTDISMANHIGVRVIVGYHSLLATGSSCGLSNCKLLIHYPGAGFFLRGIFLPNTTFEPWLGAGGFLLWPFVNQQADLGLDPKSFQSFHGALSGVAGVDIHFNNFYIPIQLDFNWINPVIISASALKEDSTEFKPFYIGAKIGIAMYF